MAKPLNNKSIEVESSYNENASNFQTMIEKLFKIYIKSCNYSSKKGE